MYCINIRPLRIPSCVRFFSQSSTQHGRIKKVLNLATQHEIYVPPSRDREKILDGPKRRRVKPGQERTASDLRRQKAAHILGKMLNEKVDHKDLGPTSDKDLKFYSSADRMTLLSLLGTTVDQIQNSVIVAGDVQAFLKRDQPEKAMTLARLAGKEGIVGMNFVEEYFLERGRYNDALRLHQRRKKWNVKTNDLGLTTFFSGFAKFKLPNGDPSNITFGQARTLKQIFLHLKETDELKPNTTHLNSCLSALLRCKDQSIAFSLLRELPEYPNLKDLKPDKFTFTILLQGLAHSENDVWAAVQANELLDQINKMPKGSIDYKVLQAYIQVFLKRDKLYLVRHGIEAAQTFFDIPQKPLQTYWAKFHNPKQMGEQLNFGKVVSPFDHKLAPNRSLIDMLMLGCLLLGDNKFGIELFEHFKSTQKDQVDLALIHRYMKAIQFSNRKEAGQLSVALYQEILNGKEYGRVKPNDTTAYIVYEGFSIEAQANPENRPFEERPKLNKILQSIESFTESVYKPENLRLTSGYLKSIRNLALSVEDKKIARSRVQKFLEGISDLKYSRDLGIKRAAFEHYKEKLSDAENRLIPKRARKYYTETQTTTIHDSK